MNTNFSLDTAQSLFTSDDEFPVDFDEAWRWLQYARKDHGKRFLIANFIEGYDFLISRELQSSVVSPKPSEKILLTIECLKRWGMMCGTSKGQEVRQYFLECEKRAKQNQSKPLSPAELIIAQGQALLAIEQKQAQLEAEQLRLSQVVTLEAQRTDSIEALVHQHDHELDRVFNSSGHYYTVMGYCSLKNRPIAVSEASKLGKKATRVCRQSGIDVVPVADPRFGRVNSYPEHILDTIIS